VLLAATQIELYRTAASWKQLVLCNMESGKDSTVPSVYYSSSGLSLDYQYSLAAASLHASK